MSYDPWPDRVPYPSMENQSEYRDRLTRLMVEGHAAGMNVAEWIPASLEQAAEQVPDGVEGLLRQRPGSWEADLIRRLAGADS